MTTTAYKQFVEHYFKDKSPVFQSFKKELAFLAKKQQGGPPENFCFVFNLLLDPEGSDFDGYADALREAYSENRQCRGEAIITSMKTVHCLLATSPRKAEMRAHLKAMQKQWQDDPAQLSKKYLGDNRKQKARKYNLIAEQEQKRKNDVASGDACKVR